MARTRTYHLRLSAEGCAIFLRCHHRLAQLVGELISYGATLFVATAILARRPPEEMFDDGEIRAAARFAGDHSYYVGFSHDLADLSHKIGQDRLAANLPAPTVSRLYLLALGSFSMAEDRELREVYSVIHRS